MTENELRKCNEIFIACWKLFKRNSGLYSTEDESEEYCKRVITEANATYDELVRTGHDKDISLRMCVAAETILSDLCKRHREKLEAESDGQGVQMGFYDLGRESA